MPKSCFAVMFERFVPLAAFLRPERPRIDVPPEEVAEPVHPDVEDAVGAARRFRAALSDALDVAVVHLLREISANVLGRELKTADCDVAAIVAAALARFEDERVLVIRAHREDLDALAVFEIECVADSRLRRGEVLFEVRSGTIDQRFAARLEAAIAACVP